MTHCLNAYFAIMRPWVQSLAPCILTEHGPNASTKCGISCQMCTSTETMVWWACLSTTAISSQAPQSGYVHGLKSMWPLASTTPLCATPGHYNSAKARRWRQKKKKRLSVILESKDKGQRYTRDMTLALHAANCGLSPSTTSLEVNPKHRAKSKSWVVPAERINEERDKKVMCNIPSANQSIFAFLRIC